MTELVRPWRGVSPEDRRAERRARLLEGCLNVVGEGGIAAATVDRVCADAKLTKRYFYESFDDLDALLLASLDALFSSLRAQMEEAALAAPDRTRRIHAVVTLLIDVLSGDPRLARLYVESPGHVGLRVRRDQAITAFTDFVSAQVLVEPASAGSDEQRLLATRLIVAGTTDLVTSWLAGDLPGDRDAIIAAIERLGAAA